MPPVAVAGHGIALRSGFGSRGQLFAMNAGDEHPHIPEVKMSDDKLAADEARRIAQHEAVKSEVERDVSDRIVDRATAPTTQGESQRLEAAAGEMRTNAIREAVSTEREVDRARGVARGSQVLDYLFYILYALLGIRLVLALMAANPSAGFVQFIRSVTDPLYAPFRGIVPSPTAEGGYTLALPIVIALIVYMLVHAAINGLLRLSTQRKTSI
jgi:uncharacterized protein YggT (Ycf19 family)